MALEAPTSMDFNGQLIVLIENEISYTDPQRTGDLQLHAVIGRLVVTASPYNDENGNRVVPTTKVEPLTDDIKVRFLTIRGLLSGCATNAESLVNKLKIPNADVFKRSATYVQGSNAYEVVKHFDFMTLKDRLFEYIKADEKYSSLPAHGKKTGKPFRTEINNFIIYRNIFTHGTLRVIVASQTYCLEYIDNHTKQTSYLLVTPKLINDFNEVYTKFNQLIDDFRSIGA